MTLGEAATLGAIIAITYGVLCVIAAGAGAIVEELRDQWRARRMQRPAPEPRDPEEHP